MIIMIMQISSKSEYDYWMKRIEHGPNAALYERLDIGDLSKRFTDEQREIGVRPLFFGYALTDKFVYALATGTIEDRKKEIMQMTKEERERERIQELAEGRFELPENAAGLLRNAERIVGHYERRRQIADRCAKYFTGKLKMKDDHNATRSMVVWRDDICPRVIMNVNESKAIIDALHAEGVLD